MSDVTRDGAAGGILLDVPGGLRRHLEREQRRSKWKPKTSLREYVDAEAECPSPFGHHTAYRCTISERGVRMIMVQCDQCHSRTDYVKHGDLVDLLGVDPESIPVDRDNRCRGCAGEGCSSCISDPCSRCKRYVATERHHTAPRALFPDADLWPIVNLCQACHSHWHAVVTPGLRINLAPVAAHLADEWNNYLAAREALHSHRWTCGCHECDKHRDVYQAFDRKYHNRSDW